jgi:hypothetical protein
MELAGWDLARLALAGAPLCAALSLPQANRNATSASLHFCPPWFTPRCAPPCHCRRQTATSRDDDTHDVTSQLACGNDKSDI